PEKRPFFLENAGFFSVGNQGEVDLFFSRRIGLSANGESVPIIAGGRMSGKAGKYNIGLLNMQTNDVDNRIASNNFSVVRVSRDLPNRSQFGGLITQRQATGDLAGTDDYGRTYALDGRWGINQNTVVSGFFAKTDTPGVSGEDTAFNIRSRTNLQRIDIDAGYQEVGDNFNPQVGFLSRDGYRKPDVRIMTRFRPKRIFQELRPHSTYRGFWGKDGFQETGYWHIDNHWQFKDSTEVHTGVNFTLEGVRVPFQIYPGIFVPPGTYRNAEVQPVVMTNQGRAVSLNLQTFFGGFFSGHRRTINPTVRFRAGHQLTGEVSYQRNDVDLPQGDFVTNLVRTRLSYSFTPRLFVQSLVQYNDRADVWSMNLRVGWLQAANTGLFVVYNDTRGLYELNPTPQREDRSLVIKFSRMFDLLQ
ncbi:MAG: hydrolase, partial [Acidobacteria bacterium]|nr:hydrolase [Acidobacteriota bacterium]